MLPLLFCFIIEIDVAAVLSTEIIKTIGAYYSKFCSQRFTASVLSQFLCMNYEKSTKSELND